jgi:hypothetical protein
MQSWVSIPCAWVGGILVGLVLRGVLASCTRGLVLARPYAVFFLPANRLAFWAALIAGLLIGAALIPRAMMKDLGVMSEEWLKQRGLL